MMRSCLVETLSSVDVVSVRCIGRQAAHTDNSSRMQQVNPLHVYAELHRVKASCRRTLDCKTEHFQDSLV